MKDDDVVWMGVIIIVVVSFHCRSHAVFLRSAAQLWILLDLLHAKSLLICLILLETGMLLLSEESSFILCSARLEVDLFDRRLGWEYCLAVWSHQEKLAEGFRLIVWIDRIETDWGKQEKIWRGGPVFVVRKVVLLCTQLHATMDEIDED